MKQAKEVKQAADREKALKKEIDARKTELDSLKAQKASIKDQKAFLEIEQKIQALEKKDKAANDEIAAKKQLVKKIEEDKAKAQKAKDDKAAKEYKELGEKLAKDLKDTEATYKTTFADWEAKDKAVADKLKELQLADTDADRAPLKTAYDALKAELDTLVEKKTKEETDIAKWEADIKTRRDKVKTDRTARMTKLTETFDADKLAYETAYDLLATKKG